MDFSEWRFGVCSGEMMDLEEGEVLVSFARKDADFLPDHFSDDEESSLLSVFESVGIEMIEEMEDVYMMSMEDGDRLSEAFINAGMSRDDDFFNSFGAF